MIIFVCAAFVLTSLSLYQSLSDARLHILLLCVPETPLSFPSNNCDSYSVYYQQCKHHFTMKSLQLKPILGMMQVYLRVWALRTASH